jgi:hypothetical protein
MESFQKFIAITKVDAARREVYGVVASETPDKDGEICDYASTRPEYEAWSAEFERATEGKSLGNVREMHTHSAVGKVTRLDFDDGARTISVCAKVVDDEAWEKCQEGVYTGFSHGGRYLKVWQDPAGQNHVRYTAQPTEVSLVDNPCNPDAHFEYVKADGSVEVKKFVTGDWQPAIGQKETPMNSSAVGSEPIAKSQEPIPKSQEPIPKSEEPMAKSKTKRVADEDLPASAFAYVGDPEDTSTWKLPIHFSDEEKTKSHIRNALARFEQTEGIPEGERAKVKARIIAAAKKHGIEVTEKAISDWLLAIGQKAQPTDETSGLLQMVCPAERDRRHSAETMAHLDEIAKCHKCIGEHLEALMSDGDGDGDGKVAKGAGGKRLCGTTPELQPADGSFQLRVSSSQPGNPKPETGNCELENRCLKLEACSLELSKERDAARAEAAELTTALTKANEAIERLLAEPRPPKTRGGMAVVTKEDDSGQAGSDAPPAVAKMVKGNAKVLQSCLAAGTVEGGR